MISTLTEVQQAKLFMAFDIALKSINLATCALWNAPITVDKELDRDSFTDAYAEIEKHGLVAAHVFMSVRDYSDIRKFGRQQLSVTVGPAASFLGAEIIVSRGVAEGTVYVCAAEAHMHLIQGSVYIINQPWGVASITIKRDDSDNHAPLETNHIDDNLRSVFG